MLLLGWAKGPACFARLNNTNTVDARLIGGLDRYVEVARRGVGRDLIGRKLNNRWASHFRVRRVIGTSELCVRAGRARSTTLCPRRRLVLRIPRDVRTIVV